MEHRGEIVKKAIENSGISLTEIARRMKKSRQWLYDQFDNPTLSFEYILELGKIIHFDFTNEIRGLNFVSEPQEVYNKQNENYWKDKYYQLLEEHNELLKKMKM